MVPDDRIFISAARKEGFFFFQRPAGHVKNYHRLERGHTWPVLPVDKIPRNYKNMAALCKNLAAGPVKWAVLESYHRRRVQSGKVLLSPGLFADPSTYGLSDARLTYTQNPRRCPSVEISGIRAKTMVPIISTSCNLILHPFGRWKEPKRTF